MALHKTKRWHLVSILRSQHLVKLFEETAWEEESKQIALRHVDACRQQGRHYLDGIVPTEMLVHGASKAGLVAYRSDNGYLRSSEPGDPIPLAWVIEQYGSEFAEDLLEAGLKLEPAG